MPFYSDPGYYYSGGGYQLYSPYYSSSPYSTYSSYSRPLSGSYIVPSSRINLSTSRYKPKLSTISETPLSSRSTGLIPLTRIQSPKVSYHTSPHFKPPRPIPINTADIDVSASKYRKREKSEESDESKKIETIKESDCNNNNVQESSPTSPFMPRVDGTDPGLGRHRSTIKRDRPVVRLSIMRQRSKGSQNRDSHKSDGSMKKPSPKKKRSRILGDAEKKENLSWRDMFGDELHLKHRVSPKKSPGELMKERYLIKDKEKNSEVEAVEEKGVEMPIDVEEALIQLSRSKPPSFHDICEDISSDKIDDDLNAGELRRRASLIQEQEAEIINQLQKSASGTFHLILERCESEDDCRKSVKRKSKKGRKVRHKITATVQIDNPPLTPIIQEGSEDAEPISPIVEPKLKVNVEKIEEDHTVHKIFKLPKKKDKTEKLEKIEKQQDKCLEEKPIEQIEAQVEYKTSPTSPKIHSTISPTKSEPNELIESTQSAGMMEKLETSVKLPKEIQSPTAVQSPRVTQSPTTLKSSTDVKSPTALQSPTTPKTPTGAKTPVESKKPLKKPSPIKSSAEVKSPTKTKTPTKVKSLASTQSPKVLTATKLGNRSSKPEFFTFDMDDTKPQDLPKTGTPMTPKTLKFAIPSESPKAQPIAKPKPIVKMQKCDSGEDFWAQIGSRETLYMNERKKRLLENQWAKRESLLENQDVRDSNEAGKLNEIKQKIGSQKAEALKKAEESIPEEVGLKRSESSESVFKDSQEDAEIKEETGKGNLRSSSQNKETKVLAAKTQQAANDKISNNFTIKPAENGAKPAGTGTKPFSKEAQIKEEKSLKTIIESSATKTPEVLPPSKLQSTTENCANIKVLQQAETKINSGLKAKSPEMIREQDNKNIKNDQIPSAEENVRTAKKVSPQSKTTKKSKSQDRDRKEESGSTAAKTELSTSLQKGDVNRSASQESGRKGEIIEEKAKRQSNSDHQQNDKIRPKETGSRKEGEKLIGSSGEKHLKGPNGEQKLQKAPSTAESIKNDVKSGVQSQKTEITSTTTTTNAPSVEENQKSHEPDKKTEKNVGGDINDANLSDNLAAKDELARNETSGCKLSKYPTVSDLNRCLKDVDADLSDYIPSEEDSSYGSSEDEGDSMKKKNRDKKKEEKFNPNKVIKLDHKNKCYVKNEAPPYPLIATPRPLWKREKFSYPSDSESEESESESECTSSDESSDELNPNKDNIIRMSTCSSDSGFEGGTAPSSPKKMLGKNRLFQIYAIFC